MDDLQRSLLNVFTNCDLDRMVQSRKDSIWLNSVQKDSGSRFVVFRNDQFLLSYESSKAPVFVSPDELEMIKSPSGVNIFLGSRGNHHFFAAEVEDVEEIKRLNLKSVKFGGLRGHGWALTPEHASMLSYAKTMFHWHRANEYCGTCGTITVPESAGHVRRCTSQSCGISHFPRTDPAIIVAVSNGEKCLFGRQPSWPQYRHSVIAGFVEPGESIEQAVVREVMEETNIELDCVNYHSSQPWPFPGSIMLGFTAKAGTEIITLNDGELENAHWRSASDVIEGLKNKSFLLPPKLSIAYRLIEDWFNENSVIRLADMLDELEMSESHRV